MAALRPCHLLIGLPASGKSHLAQEWVKRDPAYVIISTDAVREKLYGDAAIQGDWQDIQAEVMGQIEQAIAQQRPIIYDATNVRRAWRLGFLQAVNELGGDRPPDWIAWQLNLPLKTCKQRNQTRQRVVPSPVIDRMAEALANRPVIPAEGFLDVRDVPLDFQGDIDFAKLFQDLDRIPQRVRRRHNRNSQVVWHPYAALLDFERLLYLIAYHLHSRLDNYPEDPSLSGISTAIAQQQGAVYGNPEAIAADLNWLRSNDFFNPDSHQPLELEAIPNPHPLGNIHCHRYSDRQKFIQLMETIRGSQGGYKPDRVIV